MHIPMMQRRVTPHIRPRFGGSYQIPVSKAPDLSSALLSLVPAMQPQVLKDIIAKANEGTFKPLQAGLFADGKIAVISYNTADDDMSGIARTVDDDPPPCYKVLYGKPDNLEAHYANRSLSMSSCTEMYFSDGFQAGMDSGLATGRTNVSANGQNSVKSFWIPSS